MKKLSPNDDPLRQADPLSRGFSVVAMTLPGLYDPAIAIAASRAAGVGVLDLEYADSPGKALASIESLACHAKGFCGVKLGSIDKAFADAVLSKLPTGLGLVVFTQGNSKYIAAQIKKLHKRSMSGSGSLRVAIEVTTLEEAGQAEKLGADVLIAKGNEASGIVGEKTAFVLLQQIIDKVGIPVWLQGGIGLYTASAAYGGGAAGVVLDSQLALTRESSLSGEVRARICRMDGAESVTFGVAGGATGEAPQCRVYATDPKTADSLIKMEFSAGGDGEEAALRTELRRVLKERLGWESSRGALWLLGQDVAFAAYLAERFVTVGGVVSAIKDAVSSGTVLEDGLNILGEGSLLAAAHGTRYPIVQGPMARVSDRGSFARAVAEAGALPFVAMSTISAAAAEDLLKDSSDALGEQPWGVGLLGFISDDILNPHLEAVYKYAPSYAILAGGRPQQAQALESRGISTYMHVPSPGLLDIYIDAGIRRFIFEGSECGGHIGPRSSFVLWELVLERLIERLDRAKDKLNGEELYILFAGGIHDGLSGAMVSLLAAPLARRGVRVGALMGTAYLFTKEAVKTGAVVKKFQKNAIECSETRVLETGPGHKVRCCDTPFVGVFEEEKKRLRAGKLAPDEITRSLEDMVVGRLRLASKGLVRESPAGGRAGELKAVKEDKQQSGGIYMVGQLAALRRKGLTIEELHSELCEGAAKILKARLSGKETGEDVVSDLRPSDVAIIGMSCLFPKADDLRTYWENILSKVDAITEVPHDRWDLSPYFDADTKARDKIYSKWGGFIKDRLFDPMKYGMPPNSLNSIEPMQLLTLEVVDAALKDAGYEKREFRRERTSVILGTGAGISRLGERYILRSSLPALFEETPAEVLDGLPEWTEDSFPGILTNILAGRVANRFDLGGVNYTIDAACASSLAALYDAVRELETGSSDMVIAGGVDTTQNPFNYMCFSKTHALSPRGRCQVFDEKADGTVISEGLAAVVLKRLADAERDGDRIYAVVKSVAGASDGRDKSLTAPRAEGQVRALKRAYAKAGFPASTVGLWEAHGTGTVVGDKVEAESAMRMLKESNAGRQSCAIGSVKSMIGHTKGAAGFAGIIKVALSLYYKVLAPTAGVDTPTKAVDFKDGPLYLNTELRPWIETPAHPRRAGVSAFGFGGTNFHGVLEEYTGGFTDGGEAASKLRDRWPSELFLWAGQSREELLGRVGGVKKALDAERISSTGDLAFTLYQRFALDTQQGAGQEAGAGKGRCRLSVVAASLSDLKDKLDRFLDLAAGGDTARISEPRGIFFVERSAADEAEMPGKVAFLFPGQGSQYPGMLSELAVFFPEVRRAFERADAALKDRLPQRLSSYVYPAPSFSKEEKKAQRKTLSRTDLAQPAIGAASYGVFEIFKKMGLFPDMVAGHSYGEYVALCVAEVFGEQSLYRISEARGRSIIEAGAGKDLGTMAAVKASADDIRGLLKDADGVVLANINAPLQSVISGAGDDVRKALELLDANGLQARAIPVSAAFHSPLVAPAKELFAEFLKGMDFASPKTEVFSNNLAAPYGSNPDEIKSLLVEHIVRPVEFVKEIEAIYNSGARVFVELGPNNILTNLTRQILEGRDFVAVSTDISGGSALAQLLKAFGQVMASGVGLDLSSLYSGRSLKTLDLELLQGSARDIKEEVPATAWVINGSGAHKYGEASTVKDIFNLRVGAVQGSGVVKRPVQEDFVAQATGAAQGAGAGANAVMQRYQQMMSRFLETQKGVMTSYLRSRGRVAASGATDTVAAVIPQRIEKEAEAVTGEMEGSSPAGSLNALSGERIRSELLRITSERTGYPADMLDMDSDMEADLGIDSIKRVEILSAYRDVFTSLDEAAVGLLMEELAGLKTLGAVLVKSTEMVGSFGAAQSGGHAADTGIAAALEPSLLKTELLRITSERTGYPADMLDMESDMEADLGIDSIKRVEILSAYRDVFTSLDEDAVSLLMEELAGLKTLGAVLAKSTEMAASSGVAQSGGHATVGGKTAALEPSLLRTELLRITSERTGYPADMLDMESDMEADLGIDSIKRVEILSAYRDVFTSLDEDAVGLLMEELAGLKTLGAVLAKSTEFAVADDPAAGLDLDIAGAGALSAAEDSAEYAASTEKSSEGVCKETEESVPRALLEQVVTPLPQGRIASFEGAFFVVTGDGQGVARALIEDIKGRGGKAVLLGDDREKNFEKGADYLADFTDPLAIEGVIEEIRRDHGGVAGLLHLRPMAAAAELKDTAMDEWRARLKAETKSFFYLTKALSEDIRKAGSGKGPAWLVTAAALTDKEGFALGRGGLAGFVKSVAQEWPGVKCCALSMDAAGAAKRNRALSATILNEITAVGVSDIEVAYRGSDRSVFTATAAPLGGGQEQGVAIKDDYVIMVTGGAVGITALVALELAERYRPTLLLVGRSPLPGAEPQDSAGLTDEREIKAALIKRLKAKGGGVTPVIVGAAYERLLKDREIRANIEAMKGFGSEVRYFQASVSSEEEFGKVINEIYDTYGRLDGVIHGAGVIEDKLVEDKTAESFDRVFDTKADSAFILSKTLRPETLKFLVFFTSVAGSFGNRGQADYATANELVSGLALSLDATFDARVVAMNWGPWKKKGMVTPEVERQFAERGVQLIPPSAGSRMLEEELRLGRKGEVGVVIGGGPWLK